MAARGWVIITRDRAITRNPREKNLVKAYAARLVILSGSEAGTTFRQLEIVMSQWRRIEACLDEPGARGLQRHEDLVQPDQPRLLGTGPDTGSSLPEISSYLCMTVG